MPLVSLKSSWESEGGHKFKSLLGLLLQRAYKIQSDKHFCFKPDIQGFMGCSENLYCPEREITLLFQAEAKRSVTIKPVTRAKAHLWAPRLGPVLFADTPYPTRDSKWPSRIKPLNSVVQESNH